MGNSKPPTSLHKSYIPRNLSRGMAAITCESLTKSFKTVTVLNNITLEVEEKTLFGFLAPENSGKTTLMSMLTGILKPTSGSCCLFDINVLKSPEKALQNVGCLVGEPAFYQGFTAEENVHLFAGLTKTDAVKAMEAVNMTFGSVRAEHLTPGMNRQLGMAVALLGSPSLLLLDEPLKDLGPADRSRMISLLKEKAEEETTTFFTTSSLADVKDMATEAAVLKGGEITAQGPAETVSAKDLEVNP